MTSIKERINLLRGLGIIGVIAIHSTAPILNPRVNDASLLMYFIIIINQFFRYSVPLFFFISAYLYGKKYASTEINYCSFIYNRIKKIYIPFIFWSMLYIGLRVVTGDIVDENLSLKNLFTIFITGSSFGHLYFIPAIFQFYLILPLLLYVAKLIKKYSCEIIYLTVIFVVYAFIYDTRSDIVKELNLDVTLFKSYWFYLWYPFCALGLQAGISFESLKKIRCSYLLVICIIFLFVINYEYIIEYKNLSVLITDKSKNYDTDAIATFLRPTAMVYAATSIVYIVFYLPIFMMSRILIIEKLGVYSFGIYLCHPLINKCIIKIIKCTGVDITYDIISFPVLLVLGLYVSYLLVSSCNNKLLSYLVGNSRIND